MGSPPVQERKEKPPSSSNSSNGSPLILIIAGIAIIAVVIYLFKDKIFKKKTQNLADLKKEEPIKEELPTEPETLKDDVAQDINDKFAKLN